MEKPVSIASLFDSILDAYPDAQNISVQEIIDYLGTRAYGPLLMLFAAPNVVPNVPGSGVFSAPLMPLAYQMARGNPPWLPRRLAERRIGRETLLKLRDKMAPSLRRVNRAVRPRLGFLTAPWAERALGLFLLPLTFVLFLPIPLGNMMPAWSVAMLGVGILERDGVWVLAGLAMGVAALVVATLVVLTAGSLMANAVM